jgi:hypothetical protein
VANKVIDYFIPFPALAVFLGLLFLPDTIAWPLTLISFFVIGLWAVLFPQGVISWVKTAHHQLDETDPALWWLPRLIGTFFMLFAGAYGLVFLLQR